MAMLKSIHIQGFKSIRDARVELGRVNVLIGANASGKSNLVAFLRMLRAIAEGRFQQFVAQAGGSGTLLRFGPKVTKDILGSVEWCDEASVRTGYDFTIQDSDDERFWFGSERVHSGSNSAQYPPVRSTSAVGLGESRVRTGYPVHLHSPTAENDGQAIAALAQPGIHQFHDTSMNAGIRRSVYIDDNRELSRDGSNLAAVLHVFAKMKPAYYRRIVATVRQVFPQFDDFVLEPDALAPTQIRLNWHERGQDALFGPHQFSDGTLRFIALATLLLQPEDELPKVIVIDEPELGLHPNAITVLASLVQAASLYSQVIIATQSVTLLDQFEPADVIVVERDRIHHATEFRRLDADELAGWLENYTLGDLWRKNVIGGGPRR